MGGRVWDWRWTKVAVAIWLGVAVVLSATHHWSLPGPTPGTSGVTTVTGSIFYWLTYSGLIGFMAAAAFAAVFYVCRSIVRGTTRLLRRLSGGDRSTDELR